MTRGAKLIINDEIESVMEEIIIGQPDITKATLSATLGVAENTVFRFLKRKCLNYKDYKKLVIAEKTMGYLMDPTILQ